MKHSGSKAAALAAWGMGVTDSRVETAVHYRMVVGGGRRQYRAIEGNRRGWRVVWDSNDRFEEIILIYEREA